MKLFELQEDEIKVWLDSMGVTWYTINSDRTVDVGGGVDLSHRRLKEIPVQFRTVRLDFFLYDNDLTSLKGSPKEVGGVYYCTHNKLTTLEGGPKEVGRDFFCNENKLTTLKGSPRYVGGDFYCGWNRLTSLKGAPKEVGGNFGCDNNNFQTEPDHSFIEIGGKFTWEGVSSPGY